MEKTNLIIVILALGLVLTSVLLVYRDVWPATKGTLSASGNSEVTVAPDKADIYVNVQTSASTAKEAKDSNSERIASVKKALKNNGVNDDDIETERFNIYPDYRWDDITKKQVLDSYRAQHVLKVSTKKIDTTGGLIDVAVDAGADTIERVAFGLSEEKQREVSDKAMQLASKKAQEKAESLSKSLGVKIVRIISVSESNFNYVPYNYPLAVKAAGESASTEISPSDVKVYATVNVNFEIR